MMAPPQPQLQQTSQQSKPYKEDQHKINGPVNGKYILSGPEEESGESGDEDEEEEGDVSGIDLNEKPLGS